MTGFERMHRTASIKLAGTHLLQPACRAGTGNRPGPDRQCQEQQQSHRSHDEQVLLQKICSAPIEILDGKSHYASSLLRGEPLPSHAATPTGEGLVRERRGSTARAGHPSATHPGSTARHAVSAHAARTWHAVANCPQYWRAKPFREQARPAPSATAGVGSHEPSSQIRERTRNQ